jgi:hypothetical protein
VVCGHASYVSRDAYYIPLHKKEKVVLMALDLVSFTLKELSEKVKNRELKSADLTHACLERIKKVEE